MRNDHLRGVLTEIYERRGELSPAIVMEEARPRTSPLHAAVFDRPPKEAAQAWYLGRAHELIRKARVRYVDADGTEEDVRAFVATRSPTSPSGFAYRPAAEVAEDPLLSKMALRQMEHEWRALFRRFRHFEEFVTMVRGDIEDAA